MTEPEPEPGNERDETREAFAEALADWGLTPTQVSETLEATDFSLGLVELRPAGGGQSQGIAVVVDDRRDAELRELFAWRAETEDAAGWEIDGAPLVRVVLGPDEQALVRFALRLRRPVELERRFLFAVHAVARQLAQLQVAGTDLWLVPSTLIEKEIARDGPADTYDLVRHCLHVGRFDRPVPSIDEALAHVGSPRESQTAPPMNRAERRAAARKKV
ncbi:MAG: hypothetical protein ACR2KV_08665 [Solirubrobacteraceae bacterium]